MSFLRRLLDMLFGYDFFISYAHRDGHEYAEELNRALTAAGFDVHLDTQSYVVGDDLGALTKIRVRNSRNLVVVGRPVALTESLWVGLEVLLFERKGSLPFIIDVDDAIAPALDVPVVETVSAWLNDRATIAEDGRRTYPVLWLTDDAGTAPDTPRLPAPEIVEGLVAGFRGRRIASLRLRAMSVVAALLLVLSAGLGVLGKVAQDRRAQAEENERSALAALSLTHVRRDPVEAAKLAMAALPPGDTTETIGNGRALTALSEAFRAMRTEHIWKHPEGAAMGAALSPEGSVVALWDRNGSARFVDARSGKETDFALPTEAPVVEVAFSPDGSRIATRDDRVIRIWDARTRTPVSEIVLERSGGLWVMSMAFSPDGRSLVAGLFLSKARLFDASTGQRICDMTEHGAVVRDAAFSRDGTRIVTGSDDGRIRVFDAKTCTIAAEAGVHGAQVLTARFSPDGTSILSASGDGTAVIWRDLEAVTTFRADQDRVMSATFSEDGQRVMTASETGVVRLWSVAENRVILRLPGATGQSRGATLSHRGDRVLTTTRNGVVRLWNVARITEAITVSGHEDLVRRAAFSPDGKTIGLASWDGSATIRDAADGKLHMRFDGHGDWVNSIDFSRDGTLAVTASRDGTARVWNVSDGEEIARLTIGGSSTNSVTTAMFSPDAKSVVTASFDGIVRIWSVAEPQSAVELSPPEGTAGNMLHQAVYSPDGRYIATATANGEVRIWNARTHVPLLRIEAHDKMTMGVAFSPDGSMIASASEDGSVKLWNAADGQPLRSPAPLMQGVQSVAFSPKGDKLIGASLDKTARVWDVATGAEVARIDGFADSVWSAGFSPDGKRAVVTPGDHTARIWNLALGEGTLIALTCRALPRVNGSIDRSYAAISAFFGLRDLHDLPDCAAFDPS